MRKLIILLAALTLVAPLMFSGCSGDDGAAGPRGADGTNGLPGPGGPGALAKETCVVCHGTGTEFDVRAMHNLNTADREKATLGSVTATITAVTIGPAGVDNVPVSVTFTMVAKSANGSVITPNIDLRTAASNAATYLNFYIAKLVPGTAGSPDTWFGYVVTPGATGSGPFSTSSLLNGGSITGTPATGVYTYTFPDNAVRVSGGFDNNLLTHRVGMQIYNLPRDTFWTPGSSLTLPAPFANDTFDSVPATGVEVTPPPRDIVTTDACNQCHDPLGFHSGGARYDTKVCVICHASNIASGQAGWDNAYMVKFIHGIHAQKNLGTAPGRGGTPTSLDFSKITYPQNVKNCDTCHQGTDGDNWKNKPSREGCGSCHTNVNFATGANHPSPGGIRLTDAACATCHDAAYITSKHADPTATPTNVPAGLDNIAYFIDNVTVDNNSFPVVTFRVTKNGTPIVFTKYTGTDNAINKRAFVDNGLITGYSGSPSFLVAFAANQDGINPVADYNNLGNNHAEGQPATVSVAEIFLNDNNAGIILSGPASGTGNYTVKLLKDVTRATAANGGAITSSVTAAYPAGAIRRAVGLQGRLRTAVGAINRYTTSAVKTVTGDTARRTTVDSTSCLECHKVLALHGGNRVNNVQICVMCHNPNLGVGGTQSLNMKDMVHAVHAATTSYPAFASRGWDNITYPGELSHCTKCHYADVPANSPLTPNSYKANLPAGVLLSTGSEMGLAPADNDIVISPTAAACGRCHNTSTAIDHFRLNGGDVGATRAEAAVTAPPTSLAPDVLSAP